MLVLALQMKYLCKLSGQVWIRIVTRKGLNPHVREVMCSEVVLVEVCQEGAVDSQTR